ncbi:hypothetical protein BGZ52_002489 [Haplosporangium bisporale]|nr:hypothetical protein BGZ52_002489 [Haplosporangium bisporale]
MTATEALRAKAGSRATYRTRGDDSWSAHDTEVSQDGHNHNNYLAPLPPFQMGPAYARVPKRKYCKWCCGGCRWWVLLLCILIPAGIMALAAVFLWHHFQVCEPIDPNGLAPMVYMVDPTTIQGIALEYQTQTKGSIRIVDSPDPNEYKVIMRLQRQFYKMENREDLTGFQSEYLPNGYSRYVLDSLNIDALTISSTSTTPSSIVLESVVVQNQLSVVSVSGNIQAAVGFDPRGPNGTTTTSAPLPQPTSSSPSSSSAMVSLNTLDGEIQFDLKAWNQTCTFKVGSPTIQVTKAGAVVLDFANSTNGGGGGGGGGWINGTHFDRNGLVVDLGYNSVSGTFKALSGNGTIVPSNATTTATMSSTRTSARPSSTTTSVMPTPTLPGPLMGAGGSLVPAQLLVQANRKVTINFP